MQEPQCCGAPDSETARSFASSWNNLPEGSVYSWAQFEEWLQPVRMEDVENKRVLELGCGNGSLLLHLMRWKPQLATGVDLGDSVLSAEQNLSRSGYTNYKIIRGDLTAFNSEGADLVYCIGVLHHLKAPELGFRAVIRNVKPGGRFHCWVYAKEGNMVIRLLVEPLRRIFSKFPWWFTKYLVATPLSALYFLYAKFVSRFTILKWLPLFEYSRWIAARDYAFFRHVAFDQLVTPQTMYIEKADIVRWLKCYSEIDADSVYCQMRNGNSWKFGGRIKQER